MRPAGLRIGAVVLWLAAAVALAAPGPAPPDPAPALHQVPGLEDVAVQRHEGVLVLEGQVTREADRVLAESVAGTQPGVDAVVNRVEVSVGLRDRVQAWREESIRRLTRLLSAAPLLGVALVLVWLAWVIGRGLSARYRRRRETRADSNPYVAALVGQTLHLGIALVGLLSALQLLDAVALAGAVVGSAGVVGIALGFAFRDLAENYVAGLLLSLRQPFCPNDHVVIDGNEGVVVGLSSRATLLMTPDGNHLRLPNAMVFKAVIVNYTRNGRRRFLFTLRLEPGADADVALHQGLAALAGVPGVLPDPPPFAQLQAADCQWLEVNYFGWCDQRSADFGWLRSECMRRVRQRLSTLGLPFQRPVQALRRDRGTSAARAMPPPTPRPPDPGSIERGVSDAVAEARLEMSGRDLLSSGAPQE